MNIKFKLTRPLDDLLHLVYPQACLICERELSPLNKHICSFCSDELTYTDFHLFEEASPMDQLFWGRVPVHNTYAHIHFRKNAGAQNLLFNLKYQNNRELGVFFGNEIGKRIGSVRDYHSAEAIIPVPLHFKKQFIRGYNQSAMLASGLSQYLEIPVNEKLVKRTQHTSTQTKKNRFQRWDNVSSIFSVNNSIKKFDHIILVDDVITTGSTIEALIRSLLIANPDLKISVVTLAIA